MIQQVKKNLTNFPGWHTKRKIVVFESDDWGSIRMPSRKVYQKLKSKGIRVDLCPYNRFDNLASPQDWTALFETLVKTKDSKGNYPVITININPANPDFQLIKESRFEEYSYETFLSSLERFYPAENTFTFWKQGIKNDLVFPQYHHREHVNPGMWLDLLKKGNKPVNTAFDHNVFGLSYITSPLIRSPYLASLLYRNKIEQKNISAALTEGSEIFEQIFGFKAKSFIAPLNTWNRELESELRKSGILYIQGGNVHKTFDFSEKKFIRTFHSLGSENEFKQTYLNRNCTFEPSIFGKKFNLPSLLKEIQNAFFWRKPAVISTHRLNFIGNLDEENRKRNLLLLDELLKKIMVKWPDVEFMNSVQLGDLIKNSDR